VAGGEGVKVARLMDRRRGFTVDPAKRGASGLSSRLTVSEPKAQSLMSNASSSSPAYYLLFYDDRGPEGAEVIEAGPEGEEEGEDEEDHAHGPDVDGIDGKPGQAEVDRIIDEDEEQGDDLGDGLVFAESGGRDHDAFFGGDGAQPGDGDLAADDQDHHPSGQAAEFYEHDHGRGDEQLVGEGVEEFPQVGDQAHAAGDQAVEVIGKAGGQEEDAGQETPEPVPAVFGHRRPEPPPIGRRTLGLDQEQERDHRRDHGDPGQGQDVGKVPDRMGGAGLNHWPRSPAAGFRGLCSRLDPDTGPDT